MQSGAEDRKGEMYKMQQATEMVSRIAGVYKKLCR